MYFKCSQHTNPGAIWCMYKKYGHGKLIECTHHLVSGQADRCQRPPEFLCKQQPSALRWIRMIAMATYVGDCSLLRFEQLKLSFSVAGHSKNKAKTKRFAKHTAVQVIKAVACVYFSCFCLRRASVITAELSDHQEMKKLQQSVVNSG